MRATAKRWGLGFLAWTVLGLLSASQAAVGMATEGRAIHWGPLLAARLVDWYTCGVFTPAFFWLARRYPIDRARWLRHVPLHIAAAAVATVGKFALQRVIVVDVFGQPFPPLGAVLAHGFISENIAFWCVIAVVHAIEFHQRVREREVLTARLRARLSEAQLTALASQLHPHFLFNTLQGISTLVYRDPAAADAMLGHLSALLRRTLQRGHGHEVTLTDELALLDEYLAIVQQRFGDRLQLTRAVAPDTLPGLVPHFVLQPLVENAIEHGIARRAGAGQITIAAERDGARLRITVSDDGPGVDNGVRAPRDGVGLGGTRQRLAELYGPVATLDLVSRAERGGTSAVLVVPYHETPLVPVGQEPVSA